VSPVAAPETYLTGFCATGNCGRCHGAIAVRCTHVCHGGSTETPPARVDPLEARGDAAAPEAPTRKRCECGARWSTTYGCGDVGRHGRWADEKQAARDDAREPEPTTTTEETATVLEIIPIDKITVDPANRAVVEDDALRALAESIREIGQLEPVVVSTNGDGVVHLVAGARRLAACRLIGLDVVEAIVKPRDAVERAVARAVENLHRLDLTPMQEAREFAEMARLGLSQRDIAKRCSVSQSHVSKRSKLLKLPADVQRDVELGPDAGGITIETALSLTELPKDALARALKAKADDGAAAMMDEVAQALADIEHEQKIAAVRKQLAADGVKVLDKSLAYQHRVANYGGVDVDRKKHQAEPCRAVVISPYDASLSEYCTDPKRHGAKGASALKAKPVTPAQAAESSQQKAARAAREAARALAEEAQSARRAFVRGLLPSKVGTVGLAVVDAMRSLLALLLLEDGGELYAKDLAFDLVGVELASGREYNKRTAAIKKWVAGADALALVRFMAATTIADVEEFGLDVGDWAGNPEIKAYFERLMAAGYELSDFESERLAPPAKKPAAKRAPAKKAPAKK
jgi:ParB/RepB/Spo0J family partition protein